MKRLEFTNNFTHPHNKAADFFLSFYFYFSSLITSSSYAPGPQRIRLPIEHLGILANTNIGYTHKMGIWKAGMYKCAHLKEQSLPHS
uniref:Uncharacterized protein n=1 Tax=Anguilla anguilla TaxID=7936 RepID=A0A0E9TG93_ANGAN